MVLTRKHLVVAALLATNLVSSLGAQRGLGPRGAVLGFALECIRCASTAPAGRMGGGRAGFAVWHYSEYPTIAAVAVNSPADRAGVKVGDVLRAVDGVSLLTEDAGAKLREVEAGDEVRLELERGGKTIDVTLTAARPGRMGGPVLPKPLAKAADKAEKVSGKLGGAGVGVPDFPADYSAHVGMVALDIWSSAPVIASTDSTGATILTVGGTTIRLRGGRGRLGGPP